MMQTPTARGRKLLKAADIMTREVIAVRPDTPAHSIAMLLFKRGISAVPVVDESGTLVGMVSEGDLMPRDESEREARRDWWLRMLAEGEELSPEFVSHVESQDRTARQIMSAPVITVPDTADLVEVAEVLSMQRIKRAPVLREGRMVGIVSRADLVRAVAQSNEPAPEPEPSPGRFAFIFPSEAPRPRLQPAALAPPAPADVLSAEGFRNVVHRHEREETSHREEAHRLAREAPTSGQRDVGWRSHRRRLATCAARCAQRRRQGRKRAYAAQVSLRTLHRSRARGERARPKLARDAARPSRPGLPPLEAGTASARLPAHGPGDRFPGWRARRYRTVSRLG
jgi:CBS domain-containing protein